MLGVSMNKNDCLERIGSLISEVKDILENQKENYGGEIFYKKENYHSWQIKVKTLLASINNNEYCEAFEDLKEGGVPYEHTMESGRYCQLLCMRNHTLRQNLYAASSSNSPSMKILPSNTSGISL